MAGAWCSRAAITAQWIVHLGMTGRLLVTTPEAPVEKHTHARLTLESGRELRFVDPRRFGRLEFRDLGKSEWLRGSGSGAADDCGRGVCRVVSRPETGDQGSSPESDAAGGRGQHLRGRKPVSRRNSSATQGGTADARGAGETAAGSARSSGACHPAGRVVGFRLC